MLVMGPCSVIKTGTQISTKFSGSQSKEGIILSCKTHVPGSSVTVCDNLKL